MKAQLLYLTVFIILLLLFHKKANIIKSYFNNRLYLCWAMMSITMFGYTPSIIQYGIRATAILLSILMLLKSKKRTIVRMYPICFLLIIFLVYCLTSTFYSVDKIQTAIKVIELFIDLWLILELLEEEKNYEKVFFRLIAIIMIVMVFSLVVTFIGMVIMPGTFLRKSSSIIGFQLTGVILSSNSIGAAAVLLLIGLLHTPRFRGKILFMCLPLGAIFLAQARTALISLLCILVVYLLASKHKFRYLLIVIPLLLIGYSNMDLIKAYFLRGADAGNIQTMSGRITMWNAAKVLIEKKPLMGYGFGSGGEIISKAHHNMSSLHSGVYETIIGIGYIGFIILLIIYIICIGLMVRSVLKNGIRKNSFEIMFMMDISIRSYVSTGLGGWHSYGIMMWYLMLISLSTMNRHKTIGLIINDEIQVLLNSKSRRLKQTPYYHKRGKEYVD